MGKFRIIIEGEGQHHTEGGAPTDANKVAKDTVLTLVAMGHQVTKGDFVVRAFADEKQEEEISAAQVDDLLPEPVAAESGAEGEKKE